MDINNELYHHGVKGMRWGVRNQQAKIVRLKKKRAKALKKSIKYSKKAKKLQKKSLKRLYHYGGKEKALKALRYSKKALKKQKKIKKYDKKIAKIRKKMDSMAQSAMNVGNDELYHYGVKGMRWGVRKEAASIISNIIPKSSQKSRILNPIRRIQKARNKRAIRKGDVAVLNRRFSKMSNSELKEAVNRIHYKDMLMQDMASITKSSNYARGNKYIDRFTDTLANRAIDKSVDAITNPMGNYIQTAINAEVAGKDIGYEVQKRAYKNLKQNNGGKKKNVKHSAIDELYHHGVKGMRWGR